MKINSKTDLMTQVSTFTPDQLLSFADKLLCIPGRDERANQLIRTSLVRKPVMRDVIMAGLRGMDRPQQIAVIHAIMAETYIDRLLVCMNS